MPLYESILFAESKVQELNRETSSCPLFLTNVSRAHNSEPACVCNFLNKNISECHINQPAHTIIANDVLRQMLFIAQVYRLKGCFLSFSTSLNRNKLIKVDEYT